MNLPIKTLDNGLKCAIIKTESNQEAAMSEEKQTLSTYVEPELAAAVGKEAADKAVSTAAVSRWALMAYFSGQLLSKPIVPSVEVAECPRLP